MKKAKKFIVAVALALALVMCMAVLGACGSTTKLDAGSYEGTYKCTYTEKGETVRAGYKVTFDIDESNCIWELATSSIPADWSGAGENETYLAPAYASGPPWNANKAMAQFSGWTVDEIMQVSIDVDSNGRPTGVGCIHSEKEVTIGVGLDEGIAFVILAVQNGIETANKVK